MFKKLLLSFAIALCLYPAAKAYSQQNEYTTSLITVDTKGNPGKDATVDIIMRDGVGNAMLATCTTVPSAKAGYAVGCILIRTSTGVIYNNTGSVTSCTFGIITSLALTYARVSGSNATTTGQTLVDVTGLTAALAINSVYEFEACLSVASSEATNGCEYGVQYSVANGTVEAQIIGTLAVGTTRSARITALNTATAAYETSASDGGVIIKGIVTTGANAGNLTIQHLKVTSGTSTVYINSYLRVIKIG